MAGKCAMYEYSNNCLPASDRLSSAGGRRIYSLRVGSKLPAKRLCIK